MVGGQQRQNISPLCRRETKTAPAARRVLLALFALDRCKADAVNLQARERSTRFEFRCRRQSRSRQAALWIEQHRKILPTSYS